MSTNSGNGNFGMPVLSGYRVEWDEAACEFVATHERRGNKLHGRNQSELNAARNRYAGEMGDQLLEITRYAQSHGYMPPAAPI